MHGGYHNLESADIHTETYLEDRLTEITSLRAYPIVSLTAGSEVSFALTEDGAIFGWGNNI
jgi:alpha-tubulin suppressor-like RCC1 family protein